MSGGAVLNGGGSSLVRATAPKTSGKTSASNGDCTPGSSRGRYGAYSKLKEYPFPLEQIPRLHWQDPEVNKLIAAEKPVVLLELGLVNPALEWDLSFLSENMGKGKCSVFRSKSCVFKYFDDKRARVTPGFMPPTVRHEMTFREFANSVRALQQKDSPHKEHLYLQQMLNDTVGVRLVTDFVQFRWSWVEEQQRKNKWGPLTSNLLLVGLPGNLTPAHYDEQHNFFAQVEGSKRCILFSPDQFDRMYTHPLSHPCDRQSQIDFDNPDYNRFPRFRDAHAVETVLRPGEVLYIPIYWFHHMECLDDRPVCTSINFWYKSGSVPEQLSRPLSGSQKIAVSRNIERMLGEALGHPAEVASFLHSLVDGRF